MKLYLLERDPADIQYGEARAFVVRALTHIRARALCNEACELEGPIWDDRERVSATFLGMATNPPGEPQPSAIIIVDCWGG